MQNLLVLAVILITLISCNSEQDRKIENSDTITAIDKAIENVNINKELVINIKEKLDKHVKEFGIPKKDDDYVFKIYTRQLSQAKNSLEKAINNLNKIKVSDVK